MTFDGCEIEADPRLFFQQNNGEDIKIRAKIGEKKLFQKWRNGGGERSGTSAEAPQRRRKSAVDEAAALLSQLGLK